MTLVELDDVVDWLKEHIKEFLFDGWVMPLNYDEKEELTKALRKFFEGEQRLSPNEKS